jgi:hypothetical protein
LIAGYGANNFSWDSYLSFTNTKAAPPELFSAPARANSGAALHGWKVDNIIAVFRILHNFSGGHTGNQSFFSIPSIGKCKGLVGICKIMTILNKVFEKSALS